MPTDPDKWTETRKTAVGLIYDMLADSPVGLTIDAIATGLGVAPRHARERVRDLRLLLGNDTINVITEPQGEGEKHLYRLVGDVDSALPWQAHRLTHLESRLETDQSVALSLVNGSDGRTIEGRKARIIETTIRLLLEQLRLMA